jgi:hypothetical protein
VRKSWLTFSILTGTRRENTGETQKTLQLGKKKEEDVNKPAYIFLMLV